jgi:hypothetical protein
MKELKFSPRGLAIFYNTSLYSALSVDPARGRGAKFPAGISRGQAAAAAILSLRINKISFGFAISLGAVIFR